MKQFSYFIKLSLFLLFILPFTQIFAQSSTNSTDSLALVSFYQSTKGGQWDKNSNWLQKPVANWFGVTVKNGRVTALDFSSQATGNNLEGSLPAEIGDLTELIVLKLPGSTINKQGLNGSIPSTIGNLKKLVTLDLSNNQLSGDLANNLQNLVDLQLLNLSGNLLTGSIPTWLGKLKNLVHLNFDYNKFDGSLPAEISSLTKLQTLSMAANALSGDLPVALGDLKSLQYIYLFENQFKGSIPSAIGGLTNLKQLQLSGNQLTGIPAEIGNLANLRLLDISSNKISSSIPSSVNNLKKLEELYLNDNQIKGSVPKLAALQNLLILDLSNNLLDGKLPTETWQLSKITAIDLSGNMLEGEISSQVSNLTKIKWLGVSSNKLNGNLPEEMGSLSQAQLLYLNNNNFDGAIPATFSQLSNLEVLTLAKNELDKLPALNSLNKLKTISAENNQLSFDDLLPNKNLNAEFSFSPQDTLGVTDTVRVEVGKDYTINLGIDNEVTTNKYQWFRNEDKLNITETNKLSLKAITTADEGLYSCQITNTEMTSLTLVSRSVYLKIQATGLLPQQITFEPIEDKTFGDEDFELSVTSDAGLPLTLNFEGPVALENKTVHILGAGEVTIKAFQKGNDEYLPSDTVIRSFTIAKAVQTIAFEPISDKALGDKAFALQAISDADLPVSFEIISGEATLEENMLTPDVEGKVTVRAFNDGDNNYTAAEATQSFLVSTEVKRSQIISFEPIADKTFGDVPFSLVAVSDVDLSVSFKLIDGPATLENDQVTITGAGLIEIMAFNSGNETYKADSAVQTFSVAKATQTITFEPISDKSYGDATFTLAAVSDAGLAISYQVLSGPVTITDDQLSITGVGSAEVLAYNTGNENYKGDSATQVFNISKGTQQITFDAIEDKTFGDPAFDLMAVSYTDLPVVFKLIAGPATLDGNKLTVTGAGEVVVEAYQGGNNLYSADSVEQSFMVEKASQTISFAEISDKMLTDESVELQASSTSDLSVTFEVSGPASLSETMLTLTGAGVVTVKASQNGNVNYFPADEVTRTFTVKEDNTVTGIDPDVAAALKISPNPVSHHFTLQSNGALWIGAKVTIVDAIGQVVAQQDLSDVSAQFDMTTQKPGLYMIIVKNKGQVKVLKIIKI